MGNGSFGEYVGVVARFDELSPIADKSKPHNDAERKVKQICASLRMAANRLEYAFDQSPELFNGQIPPAGHPLWPSAHGIRCIIHRSLALLYSCMLGREQDAYDQDVAAMNEVEARLDARWPPS